MIWRYLRHIVHPWRSLRHWWTTIEETWLKGDQAASDRITSKTGWPEW